MAENEEYRTVTRQKTFTSAPVVPEVTKYRYVQVPGIGYEHEDTGLITADPFKFEKWLEWLGRTRL